MNKDIAVIFDLDGTLLNTDLLIKKSFEHVFDQYKPGYVLSEEEYLAFLGPTLKQSFERYFPSEMCDELIQCYRDYNHRHHEDYVTVYPTVQTTLETLKSEGYTLGVVTAKLLEAAYIGLDLFDMRKYFDVILGVDDVQNVKPDPEGILKAMNKTDCSTAIYIGDNVTDIQAGKNAEVYTVGVNWTPKGACLLEALDPDFMVDEMSELISFVEGVKQNV